MVWMVFKDFNPDVIDTKRLSIMFPLCFIEMQHKLLLTWFIILGHKKGPWA